MATPDVAPVRAVVEIAGNVQGVGFRPFLYRLATRHGLRGRVANSASGVEVEVEGTRQAVHAFLADIPLRAPPLAAITRLVHEFTKPTGHSSFVIAESASDGHRSALIPADIAVCDDCLSELFDPRNRRYLFPFINCTNCGPRYTITADVPYDREATTMACFAMCSACRAEFEDPGNRRFHAQPNACADCGPRVWLSGSRDGVSQAGSFLDPPASVWETIQLRLSEGAIVAVKGIGGFHLACDATNPRAVETLRQRKQREEKPFALMLPDLRTARRLCRLDDLAVSTLTSRERPITLLPKRRDATIADSVASGNSHLGLMLPYTPVHYLLLFDKLRRPRFRALVMTSGNLSDEPIATGNREALARLAGIADVFLIHDRDILIGADDSVVRCDGAPKGLQASPKTTATIIRRSRGFVPAPLFLHRDVDEVLAVGAHFKNTIAVSRGKTVFLSQHIGDLQSFESLEFLKQSVDHLQRILGIRPGIVAHDMHPDYLSTRFAQELPDVQLVPVQHHHAHIAACMAENHCDGLVIGVVLDGTGYGADGQVWGGEILIADYPCFERAAHLRQVPMPGNEMAVRQPWRMALSYLQAAYGEDLWNLPISFVECLDRPVAELLLQAARQGVNSPQPSSCARLFDAVAALLQLHAVVSYEGQAATALEMAMDIIGRADPATVSQSPFVEVGSDDSLKKAPLIIDTIPLVRSVVRDLVSQVPAAVISRRFHQALVDRLAGTVRHIGNESGIRQVALSGGCFQNRFLLERLTASLMAMGFQVLRHQIVPANDGGLPLGQIAVASAIRSKT